jgi:hypothetical protein
MSNRLTIFAGAAAVLVGLTAFLAMRADHGQEMHEQPVLAFPNLAASGQDLGKVIIAGPSSKTTLIKQAEGTWSVEELGMYPAKIEMINRLYLDLSTLSLLEKRSANAENHAAMGLGAPGDGGAGIEITALDKSGATLAAIIQGKVKDLQSNGRPATLFVRRVGDNQAWFARSNLQVATAPTEWVDKILLPFLSSRVSQIDLRPSGPDRVILRREKPDSPNINLQDVPKGRKQDQAKVLELCTALNMLSFDGVKAKPDINMTGAVALRYSLLDGPVIDVRIKRIDGKAYAAFSVGSDKALLEGVAKEVADINAKTGGYVFILPSQKADSLTPSKEDLLQKPDVPAAAKSSKP